MRVGFRFWPPDAGLLRALAHRIEIGELPGAVSTFSLPAEAAERGEPLLVEADTMEEARTLAQSYSLYGVTPPAIEAPSELGAPDRKPPTKR